MEKRVMIDPMTGEQKVVEIDTDRIKNLFDLIEMKLDDIEEFVDELEDNGEPIEGIRRAIGNLWDEINEIS